MESLHTAVEEDSLVGFLEGEQDADEALSAACKAHDTCQVLEMQLNKNGTITFVGQAFRKVR